ncbi:MAG: hypothetical protein JWO98_4106 [Frankiales bacterium]|nr:hypothetical protein [Frankiales bacterium]
MNLYAAALIALVAVVVTLAVTLPVLLRVFHRIDGLGRQLSAESTVLRDLVREEVGARSAEVRATTETIGRELSDSAATRHGELINALVPAVPPAPPTLSPRKAPARRTPAKAVEEALAPIKTFGEALEKAATPARRMSAKTRRKA